MDISNKYTYILKINMSIKYKHVYIIDIYKY